MAGARSLSKPGVGTGIRLLSLAVDILRGVLNPLVASEALLALLLAAPPSSLSRLARRICATPDAHVNVARSVNRWWERTMA